MTLDDRTGTFGLREEEEIEEITAVSSVRMVGPVSSLFQPSGVGKVRKAKKLEDWR
jgi:hypothetical protein